MWLGGEGPGLGFGKSKLLSALAFLWVLRPAMAMQILRSDACALAGIAEI